VFSHNEEVVVGGRAEFRVPVCGFEIWYKAAEYLDRGPHGGIKLREPGSAGEAQPEGEWGRKGGLEMIARIQHVGFMDDAASKPSGHREYRS
jgi:hypothetical protein